MAEKRDWAKKWDWLDITIPDWDDRMTRKVKAALKRLKPEMLVRNANTHTIGTVRADPKNPKKMLLAWVNVAVRTQTKTGKHRGVYHYPLWRLGHIQVLKSPRRTR